MGNRVRRIEVTLIYTLLFMNELRNLVDGVSSETSSHSSYEAALPPCDEGWTRPDAFTKSCYIKSQFTTKSSEEIGSYEGAMAECLSKGAQLVTIESDKENNFVALFISPLFDAGYIGLKKDDGVWKWHTGNIPVFLNWDEGEPVDTDQYNCAFLTSYGYWYAKKCQHVWVYPTSAICEKSIHGASEIKDNQEIEEGTSESILTTDLSNDITHQASEAFYESATTRSAELTQEITNTNLPLVVSVPTALCLIIVFTSVIVVVYRTKKLRANKKGSTTMKEKLELSGVLLAMLDEDKKWKLRKLLVHGDKVEIADEQGQGAFGIVYKGRYNPNTIPPQIQIVAIKTLKERCIGSEIAALVEEALIMAEFNYIHVMSIIGVCIRREDGVPMILMPYMDNGDLNTYLRSFLFDDEKPNEKQLLLFCLQIARGMEYLATQKFVHRDLAARNCMLDHDLVVKVADFGLTRDIYTSSYYKQDQQKLLPIKWMALESLQYRRFSCKTDIWSYGVTMWEVMSLGMVPYPDLDNACVHSHVRSGTRLEKPGSCPDQMYTVMLNCWMENPAERPTFTDICQLISDYLASMCDYLNMDEIYGSNSNDKQMDDIEHRETMKPLSSTISATACMHDSKSHSLKEID